MVLSFVFNSRILQTGILQTGPNQFVENQKRNQYITGRSGMKNLPKRLEFVLLKRLCRNVLFPPGRLSRNVIDHYPGRLNCYFVIFTTVSE